MFISSGERAVLFVFCFWLLVVLEERRRTEREATRASAGVKLSSLLSPSLPFSLNPPDENRESLLCVLRETARKRKLTKQIQKGNRSLFLSSLHFIIIFLPAAAADEAAPPPPNRPPPPAAAADAAAPPPNPGPNPPTGKKPKKFSSRPFSDWSLRPVAAALEAAPPPPPKKGPPPPPAAAAAAAAPPGPNPGPNPPTGKKPKKLSSRPLSFDRSLRPAAAAELAAPPPPPKGPPPPPAAAADAAAPPPPNPPKKGKKPRGCWSWRPELRVASSAT